MNRSHARDRRAHIAGLLLASSAAALVSASQASAQAAPALPTTTAPADTGAVSEVIVTGTRLATGFTTPTPVTVVGAAQISQRANPSIADSLQELPSFRTTGGTTQGQYGSMTVGQALLDLRGLGPQRTLVLIDGRRPAPDNATGTFDVNMVPTSLVDRTEVVTGGASAAYGSDAVAGVVNFVLKDKLNGFVGNAQYGITSHDDAKSRVFSFGYGSDFSDGRGHVLVGADYSKQDPAGNMYSRDWGQREGGLLTLPATRAGGLPANILTTGVESTDLPGSLVTSCRNAAGATLSGAACPVYGTTFNSSGQATPFQFGSLVAAPLGSPFGMIGTTNYGNALWHNQQIVLGSNRYAGLAKVTYDLTPDTSVYLEGMVGRFQVSGGTIDYNAAANFIQVKANNPYLPAALAAQMASLGITQLGMNRDNTDIGGLYPSNTNRDEQVTAGIKGSLAGGWKWDAFYSWGLGTFQYHSANATIIPNYVAALYAVPGPNGSVVCGPVATNPMLSDLNPGQLAYLQSTQAAGCVPFNPFGPSQNSQAALNYVRGTMMQHTEFRRDNAAINLTGSPFSTWAGPVDLAFGGEWRHDNVAVTVPSSIDTLSLATAYFAVNPLPGAGVVSVYEGYVEAGVPLAKDVPFAKSLDLNGAIRETHYSTSGNVTTWKIGGTWDVNDMLRFRLTRSRDIRAPALTETSIPPNLGYGQVTRPDIGVAAQVSTGSADNPNLQPEIADTWTGGLVVQPTWDWARGLRLSVDYYNITINGVIATLSSTQVLNGYYLQHNQSYAQYFQFDNSQIGFNAIRLAYQNLNTQKANGVDMNVDYRVPTASLGIPGALSLSMVASWLNQNETFNPDGTSQGNLASALPRLRVTSTLTYQLDKFGAYLQMRNSSGFKYRFTNYGPDSPYYNPASALSINDNKLPSAVYFSLGLNYNIVEDGNRNLQVYGVVDNLLDKDPPAAVGPLLAGGASGSGGYNPYDLLGRAYRVGIRFKY